MSSQFLILGSVFAALTSAGAADLDANYKHYRHVFPSFTRELPKDSKLTNDNYDFKIETPYATWFMPFSRSVENTKFDACTWVPNLLFEPKRVYADGEIPCGTIEPAQLMKTLYRVELPGLQFSLRDWDYTVEPSSATVQMARNTLTTDVTEDDLYTRNPITYSTSERFGGEVRVQSDGKSVTVCTRVPGTELALVFTPRKVYGQNHFKPLLRIVRSYAPPLRPSSFLSSKGCRTFSLDQSAEELLGSEPEIAGLAVGPQYEPADDVEAYIAGGDQVAVEAKVTRDGLFQGQDLHAIVSDGSWFARLMASQFTSAVSEHFSAQARDVLERVGPPLNARTLSTQLKDRCRLLEMAHSDNAMIWTEKMRGLCQSLLSEVEFSFLPSEEDHAQQDLGCYSGSANIDELITPDQKLPWWAKRCSLSTHERFKLSENLSSYQNEFATLIPMLGRSVDPNSAWDQHLRDNRVDNYEFWLLLEELERQGIHWINEQDWQVLIPNVLAQLRGQNSN